MAVVVGAVLVGIVVVGLTREDPKKADAKAVREAGRALTSAPGLSLSGTYGEGPATFTVTSAGTARGTFRASGGQVSRIDAGSTTYLKAGPRFWTAHGESSAIGKAADGRWTKSPDGYGDLSLANLSPRQLGQNLLDPGASLPVRTSLNSVKAIRLTAAGLTYLVSAKGPHRVLRVQGRTDSNAFSFDVTPLPAMDTFFTALRKDVENLKDAYNPNIVFEETGGRPRLRSCSAAGCTASGRIQADAWGGSGAIHIVTTVEFLGTAGGVVSSCTDSAMATSKLLVRFSCRTSGGAWTSWYRAHSGRFLILAIPIFRATVNSAQDISHLLLVLAQEQQQTS